MQDLHYIQNNFLILPFTYPKPHVPVAWVVASCSDVVTTQYYCDLAVAWVVTSCSDVVTTQYDCDLNLHCHENLHVTYIQSIVQPVGYYWQC